MTNKNSIANYVCRNHCANVCAVVALLILSACTVSPSYERPERPKAEVYTEGPFSGSIGDGSQHTEQKLSVDEELPSKWWQLFESERLNALITKALEHNPELAAAESVIREARENLYAQNINFYPTVDVNGGITREKFSGAAVGFPDAPNSLFTLYNASVDVTYNLDIFNKNESIELLAQHQVNRAQWQRQATYFTLIANLTNQFIALAAIDDEINQLREIVAIEQEKLALIKANVELGGAAASATRTQSKQVLQSRSKLAEKEKERAFNRHQLAVWMGVTPSQLELADLTLNNLKLPETLPVSIPSDLLNQRPDIRLAENLVKARYAELGIAITNQLPQLTLTGGYGAVSEGSANFFDSASAVWNIGANITQPLFRAGELKHKKKSAEAALDTAREYYRETVLMSFKQVADSLRALDYDAANHQTSINVEQEEQALLNLNQQQSSFGAISYLEVLEAKTAYHQVKINRIQAQALQLSDTVALFQSLGGTWENTDAPQ